MNISLLRFNERFGSENLDHNLPLKCLNEDNREMSRDKEGEKAQNRKGRLKKLARTQPNSNIVEMESIDNLSGTKQRLWNEEEATNEVR